MRIPRASATSSSCRASRAARSASRAAFPWTWSACTENILLEAQTLGLGAVWLGIYPEQDRIEAVAKVIGAEDGCIPFALIAVGHPKEMLEPRSSKRFDMSRVRWV